MNKVMVNRVLQWKKDPVLFVREVFRAEPDLWQVDVLTALLKQQRIAMKACKGPGKSCCLAWIIWWFLFTNSNSKVIATSVTGDNLRDGLWSELSKWQRKSTMLMSLFEWKAERIVCKEKPETWFASARTFPKDADKTQQANTLAGVHADNVLFVLDEVSDYPDGVMPVAEGALAVGRNVRIVVAGNPTRTSGPLYQICTKDKGLWWVKEITGDPDDPKRAPRINAIWARQQIEQWGKDSNIVRTNVLGQFPLGSSNNLISPDTVEGAVNRDIGESEYYYAAKLLGVDCARFGDDRSVIASRQGRVSFPFKVFRELNTMELAGQVARHTDKWSPQAIFVDATGLGAGVVDRLRELGYPVFGIEFGGKPSEKRFLNKRVEMWSQMGDWLKNGAVCEDAELVAELTGPCYKFNSSGQMLLESKEDMKRRGLPSPDKADALALTFAMPVPAPGIEAVLASSPSGKRNTVVSEYDPFA